MKKSYLNSERNSAVSLMPSMTIRLLLVVLLFLSITVSAQITRIQSGIGNTTANAATSITVTLTTTPVIGNTLIAVIATRGTSTGKVTSIISTGATWTRAAQAANVNGSTTEIWYAPNVSSGAGTSIKINQSSLRSAAVVMEYSDIDLSPLDKNSSSTGNSTTASTGTTATTTQANELFIGGIGLVSSGYTMPTTSNTFTSVATSASTNTTATNNARVYALEKIVTATGTAITGGAIATSQWSGAIATFKAKVPTISSFTPANGCASTTPVTITGTNFSGTTAVTFGLTNALSFTIDSATQITATPAAGATGTIKVTTPKGTATSSGFFTVNTLSTAPTGATGTTTICSGDSTTLTVTGGSKGTAAVTKWYTGDCEGTLISSTDAITVSPTTTTTYYVTYSGTCNTTTCATITVTVNNPPTVDALPATQTIANDTAITDIVISNSNAVPGTTFSWTRTNTTNITGTISGTGDITGTLTNTTTTVQTTTYTVTATSGGCSSSTTVTVTVLPSFNISFHSSFDQDVQTIPTYGLTSTSGSNICTSLDGTNNDLDLYSGWYFIQTSNNNSDIIPIPGLTYQWQYKNVSNSSWTNMGTTKVTDIAASVMYTPGQYLFRLMVTTTAGLYMDYSDILTLTVINNYTNLYNGGNFTNQTFCTGDSPPLFIETTPIIGELTYKWYSSLTQNGTYNLISGATSATYQAPAFAGATTSMWFYRLTTYLDNGKNGCKLTSKSNPFSLTTSGATSAPGAPSVIVVQPTCAARTTGTVTISNPINGFKYAVTLEGATAVYLSNTTVFPVGLGAYNVTAMNTCSATPSSAIPVIISMANTYNGTVWSKGTPTADQDVIFDAHYNINGTDIKDITACSCTVNPNVKVFISPTTTLTITNEVVVNGSLTFKTSTDRSVAKFPKSYSGSLVQKNDNASNIGVITYERNVPAIHPTDYIYWSSPVLNENLLEFVNSTHSPIDRLYSYDPVNDAWKNETANATNTMAQGIGYCIYGPANNSSSSTLDFNASFTGKPNNGVFTISGIGTNQSLLIGNPYPSAINADLFIKANLNVIDGSLYFWTHNTDPDNGAYTYNDYATYNLTGGTGTVGAGQASPTGITLPANANSSYINANIPNGYIAVGQGFFVGSNASISSTNPTIIFNNSMRIGGAVNGDNNSQFFKTKGNTKGKVTNAIEKDRVWLNLSNDQGVFKQTLVGYISGATNDYDTTFDADSYDSLDSADFYSVNGGSNLVIQGRALPFDENDEVPLGYRTTINGDFTIKIDQVDGSLTNQAVFIEDKLTNTVTDLKSGNYTFSTVAGTFNERFVLKYTNKTLSVDEADKEDGILVLYSNNYKTLIIHNNVMDAAVNSVALYNITGQKISNWDVKDSEQTTIQIPIKNISSGIYIVKVSTTTGESSKKIIVN